MAYGPLHQAGPTQKSTLRPPVETFMGVCLPQRPKLTFWIRQFPSPPPPPEKRRLVPPA